MKHSKRSYWASLSKKEQEILKAQAAQNNQIAQNLAVTNWANTLRNQQSSQQGQQKSPARTRDQKRNSIKAGSKAIEKLAIKGVEVAGAAVGMGWIKFIPPEAKVAIAAGIAAIAALLTAGVVALASWAAKGFSGGFGFGSGASGSIASSWKFFSSRFKQ